MRCTQCGNEIGYLEKYTHALKTNDIICEDCKETYVLENITLKELIEYTGTDGYLANRAGGKILLDIIAAAGCTDDLTAWFYEGAYAVTINNKPEKRLKNEWKRENRHLHGEYIKSVL